MTSSQFDPDLNKVENDYGGYHPNEKGLTQYPRHTDGKVNPSDCTFQGPFPPREQTSRTRVFRSPILDSVTTHYRRFVQDPSLQPIEHHDDEERRSPEVPPCMVKNRRSEICGDTFPRMRKPIDPIHWKPDLFDTPYEKYYLRNLVNENPYRPFLTSYSEATSPPNYLTEYKEKFSGNPTLETAPRTIPGLSRPTDTAEPCQNWKRTCTRKLRDSIFTQTKDTTDSHLDYNDPKRCNPWRKHLAGHSILIEPNYRPRPASGIEYSVTTVLPTVSPNSRTWIV